MFEVDYSSENFLFCILSPDGCVSSLKISIYKNWADKKYYLSIDSATIQEYENNKFNKLLRFSLILIAD